VLCVKYVRTALECSTFDVADISNMNRSFRNVARIEIISSDSFRNVQTRIFRQSLDRLKADSLNPTVVVCQSVTLP